MGNVILLVYLIDIFHTLSIFTKLLLFLVIAATSCMGVFLAIHSSEYYKKERDEIKSMCRSKVFKSLWIIALLGLLIPSKQSMYIILGLHVGNNIITETPNSPLYNKAYKVLEKSLNDILIEESIK